MKKTILIIEDDPIMRLGMQHFLSSEGYAVSLCEDGRDGMNAVEQAQHDLVITDLRLPHEDGFSILEKTRAVSPATGVIIITGYAEVKSAVQAIKDGAFDYIAKPFSNEELLVSIERFFRFRMLEDEVSFLKESLREKTELEQIIGDSPVMKGVYERIAAVTDTDVPVLIQGESGTGKELVANALHRMSSRHAKPFVKINCAAIPETLFESELFGYEQGAFTGATNMRKGKFEFADGGSIFFDEIADIPPALQPKLLRVLEDGVITRLGGNTRVQVNVRNIYATSKNLKECVAAGMFREDLFYRINVVPITIPPLRERKEDIPRLIEHFLRHFKQKYQTPEPTISPCAYEALLTYDYKGNIRELEHAIERAIILSRNGNIDINHLPDELAGTGNKGLCIDGDLTLEASVRCFEKQRIMRALSESAGKKIEAAKALGISRKVLWKKIKEHGLE